MQVVTRKLLDLGLSKNLEINESQLILLDIDIDEKDKVEELVIGKQLSDARAELFVLLKDIKDKKIQDIIINNYKNLQDFRKYDDYKEESYSSDVTIYCDGGCSPNPGESGSGVAIYRDNKLSELWYGLYEPMGTNNTAELGALYQSLLIAKQELTKGNNVEIKSDSMYSINCIKTWAISWEKNGWKKKGSEIKNLEIIKKSYALFNSLKNKLKLTHVKAHNGLEGNELADRMTIYAKNKKEKAFIKYHKNINIEKILKM